jgi:glycosyltransferase involved in cell wall biosynthesis
VRKLVTIGVPVYKRLLYLPNVLNIVAAQDYPDIELVVSDNGMNGSAVPEIVKKHYSRPFIFRQNPSTISISSHFNQLVERASGEYFLLLADDDEISSNYISELVAALERNPRVLVALSKQGIMDESGVIIRKSREKLPDTLPGPKFIKAAWGTNEYKFECFATFLARTEAVKACAGYPDFCKGHGNDDALLLKLCLHHGVVFSDRCTFRFRSYESSHGLASSIHDLAQAYRELFQFLDSDPIIHDFRSIRSDEWRDLKKVFVQMIWRTYLERWQGMYRKRLTRLQWTKAAFAMPFIPAYYKNVAATFFEPFLLHRLAPLKRLSRGLMKCIERD